MQRDNATEPRTKAELSDQLGRTEAELEATKVRCGRTVAFDTVAPNLIANLVWSGGATARRDNATEPRTKAELSEQLGRTEAALEAKSELLTQLKVRRGRVVAFAI